MYRKPRWVSHNYINVIRSQTLTWSNKCLNKQQKNKCKLYTLYWTACNTNVYRDTHSKGTFCLSTHSWTPALITTSLGLLSFHNLMTRLSLWALQKAQMLFHLRHVTTARAWHKRSKARGKFWRFTERSGHFSKRENKFFCPLSPYIHFLLWRRWMYVIWYYG